METGPEFLIKQAAAEIASEIAALTSPSAVGGIGASVGKALDGTLKAIVEDLRNGNRLAAVHKKVAREAQLAIASTYQSNVEAEKQVPSYRMGQGRFSGGALAGVINSAGFVESDGKGLKVGNRGALDTQAKHWYRLNFGAAPQAEGAAKVVTQLVINGAAIGPPIQFDEGPSGPFTVPEGGGRGYFKGPRPSEFHVGGKGGFEAKPTRGIAARRYLDAGFLAVTSFLPPLYEIANDTMTRESAKKHAHQVRYKSQARVGGRFAGPPRVNITIADLGY